MEQELIRNFAIIAHVDHGKSTLADRLLEITGTIPHDQLQEQFLDSSPISRERGITIKLAPVRMSYTHGNKKYELNLIDTPGHVDFSYEVVRTMNACEGAILLVDATKGIQAQTIANFNFAKRLNLKVIPAINKIDLPSANVEKVLSDMESLGFDRESILKISAKTGMGVEELLSEVIREVPPPTGSIQASTQALIFDSVYDEHKGIVIYVRLVNGKISKGDEIVFLSDGSKALVMDAGYMSPSFVSTGELKNGEVGYVITNIKDITQAKVGDTITLQGQSPDALPGYQPLKPFVFLSIYPLTNADFQNFRKALHTLKLTDASLIFTPEQSSIFGPGFRCGFLGLLHAQIIIERLEREFFLDVFTAPPSIEYIVDGETISNPKDFDIAKKDLQEPYMLAEIYTPNEYLGTILEFIYARRGEQQDIEYYGSQVKITFLMPLANVIYDFFDKLKSLSSGFASFDYEFYEYRASDLVRVDISVNEQVIPELSFIVHQTESEYFARRIVELLSKEIPKHQFVIAVRAQIGSRIIASEKIAALSKNVTAKLYGGDVTRKNKLLDKQKEGKKKMKMIGRVSVPKEAFLAVLKV